MHRFVFALMCGLFAAQVAMPVMAETCVWRGKAPFCAGSCEEGERSLERTANPPQAGGDSCLTGTKVLCCKPDIVTITDPTLANRLDRPGGDYKSFELSDTGHEYLDCREACARDPNCRAYTHVKAGVQGPKPMCWLKSSVPAPRYSDCCVSGVLPPFEPATNRPGGDYRNFELRTPSVTACRFDCVGDKACVSYTYVKPGVQGPLAHCWLKSSAPAPQADACCESGVIRVPGTGGTKK